MAVRCKSNLGKLSSLGFTSHPTQNRSLGDESSQAIDCTITNNGKQKNRITHASETQKKTGKFALAKTHIRLQTLV